MKIAVIGAGVAGLTCAYELKKAGFTVDVFEREQYVGGRMATRFKNNFYFDIGADHLCNLYEQIKKYCRLFGIKWEKMRFLSYYILKDDEIVPISQGVGLLSKIKLAVQYFRTKDVDFFDLSNNYEYDKDNAYHFMKTRVTKEVADYYVDSCTTTYQFHRSQAISQAVVLGMISSLKKDGEKWYLRRTKGGMSALPDAFAKVLNVQCNTEIKKVVPKGTTVYVDGEKFDAVVLATTANVTKKILKASKKQSELLNATKYSSTISIAFKVSAGTLGKKGIFWIPYVESKKLSGIVNEEMKGNELVHDGETLICTWLHDDFAKKIMKRTDGEIFEMVKKELCRVCASLTELKNHDLQRWPQAMPIYYKGYVTKVKEFLDESQGDNNIYLCGDYLNSPWTEGSVRCGQRVAKLLISKLGN